MTEPGVKEDSSILNTLVKGPKLSHNCIDAEEPHRSEFGEDRSGLMASGCEDLVDCQ